MLATAIAAGADAIVTGDRDLQALGAYRGVRIVFPRSLLERLHRLAEDRDRPKRR